MSVLLSRFVPPSPSPTVSKNLSSVSVSLFLPCNRFISTIFSYISYVCVHMWYLFFLYDLLHSVQQALDLFTSFQLTQVHSFFMSEQYSFVYTYQYFFSHSSVDGHLGCFYVLAIAVSATVNIGMHVSFWIMAFSKYMPSSGIAGSYGSFIPSF